MNEIIEISNLRVKYRDTYALDIKNLNIDTSVINALCGLNGSGKSTLLKCIAKLLTPNEGNIKIWGKDLAKMSREELKKIAVLLPEPCLLKRSVRENFAFALRSRGRQSEFNAIVPEVLALVGLDENFLNKQHFELSSGQNKRIAFALMLSLKARLNLLDEPTNAVDLGTSRLFSKAIKYAREQWGANFIIASHDEKWLSAVAQNSIFLNNGIISKFELKNIFEVQEQAIDFGEFKLTLPQNFANSKKIAINQNLININTPDANLQALAHSVSMYYGANALVKLKAGDMLLKCVISKENLTNLGIKTGQMVKFSIDNRAFLSLE